MNASENTPAGQTAAVVLDEGEPLTLSELSRSCGATEDWLVELVGEGVLEAQGSVQQEWRFSGNTLYRARVAWRLTRDLALNPPGVALALDLLDEIQRLRQSAAP